MRPLTELINAEDPGWPFVVEWMAASPHPVEVVPAKPAVRDAALLGVQVTTRSPMGAIVHECAGLMVDHGWLRILGAGSHPRFCRSLPGWNEGRAHGFYLVADDVLGGFFALNAGAFPGERHRIHYFAPDSLAWEDLGLGYSDFLSWAMSEKLGEFYATPRWNGWESGIATLSADQTLSFVPFLWAEGPPPGERDRRPIPVGESWSLQMDLAAQLGA